MKIFMSSPSMHQPLTYEQSKSRPCIWGCSSKGVT